MKKFVLVSLLSLIATAAMAAGPEVLKAVLSSKAIANVHNIEKVEVIATYRCPNCFEIEVSGRNAFGDAYVKVRTRHTSEEGLIVELIEASR